MIEPSQDAVGLGTSSTARHVVPVWSASRRRARICARSRVAVVESASSAASGVWTVKRLRRRPDRAGHGDLPRLFARGKQERRYGRGGTGISVPADSRPVDPLDGSSLRGADAAFGIRWRIADFPRRSRRCRPVPRRAPVPRRTRHAGMLVGARDVTDTQMVAEARRQPSTVTYVCVRIGPSGARNAHR